jgi:hypothetical protein
VATFTTSSCFADYLAAVTACCLSSSTADVYQLPWWMLEFIDLVSDDEQ